MINLRTLCQTRWRYAHRITPSFGPNGKLAEGGDRHTKRTAWLWRLISLNTPYDGVFSVATWAPRRAQGDRVMNRQGPCCCGLWNRYAFA